MTTGRQNFVLPTTTVPIVCGSSLAPELAREETRKLEERAAADLRSVANFVAYLIDKDLRAKRRSGRPTSAKPGDKRDGYNLVVPITIPDRRGIDSRFRGGGSCA